MANDNGIRATSTERYVNGGGSHSIKTTVNPESEHTSPTTNGNDLEPMDYRCVAQTKLQQHQVEVGTPSNVAILYAKIAQKSHFRLKVPSSYKTPDKSPN